MAIDPPYRLDPFRSIINIHWREEEPTSTGGGKARRILGWNLMGTHWPNGYNGNYIYDIYQGTSLSGLGGWVLSGVSVYSNIGNHTVIDRSSFATVWVSNASSGLFFAGNWQIYNIEGGVVENIGTYGIDLSAATLTYDDHVDPPTVLHAIELENVINLAFKTGDVSYSGWLDCDVIFEED